MDRTLEPFTNGHVSNTKPYKRADGLWTRNVYGYDMADLVCQSCILGNHEACTTQPHYDTGYSGCSCNKDEVK